MPATIFWSTDIAAEFSRDRLRPSRQDGGRPVPTYPADDVVGFEVLGGPQGAAAAWFAFRPSLDLPQTDRLVGASRRDGPAVGTEGNVQNVTGWPCVK